MKIGESSELFDISRETIRFYEREGLIAPPFRDSNDYRKYSQAHVDRLMFIKNCRNLSMPHRKIKKLLELLDNEIINCQLAENVINSHLLNIRKNIEKLLVLEKKLASLKCNNHKMSNNHDCVLLKHLLSKSSTNSVNSLYESNESMM